jgi:hypothetical protein
LIPLRVSCIQKLSEIFSVNLIAGCFSMYQKLTSDRIGG